MPVERKHRHRDGEGEKNSGSATGEQTQGLWLCAPALWQLRYRAATATALNHQLLKVYQCQRYTVGWLPYCSFQPTAADTMSCYVAYRLTTNDIKGSWSWWWTKTITRAPGSDPQMRGLNFLHFSVPILAHSFDRYKKNGFIDVFVHRQDRLSLLLCKQGKREHEQPKTSVCL